MLHDVRHYGLMLAMVTSVAACSGAARMPDLMRFRHDGPIVLVTIDTLRLDRVGVYGSLRGLTPNVDGLVAGAPIAFVFREAAAQVPLTLPSHATILTGLRPQAHGVRTNDGFKLAGDVPTLAGALHDAGYATAAFVGGFPVNASTGLARGFDRYDDDFGSAASERRADAVLQPALSWIREHRSNARLFVWIHLFDPHSPYEAPEEFASAHPGEPYDAEVAYTDAALGRFLEALRADGLLGRSMIAIVADHGESLGEHGERTHGTFLYDATIHIPMILTIPSAASPSGRRTVDVKAPVETTDLAPTLAAIAGAALSRADGVDLRAVMQRAADGTSAPSGSPRPAYAETFYQNVLLGWSPLRALRGPDWKYVEAPRAELYDLQSDPGETRNVIDSKPGIARAMAAALAAVGASPAAGVSAPRESAERLQSLGYVAGRTEASAAAGADPKDKIAVWNAIEDGIDQSARDASRAERAFREAERLDPANGLVRKYLADLRFGAGRMREAAELYRQALALGFRHPDAYINLAAIAERDGRLVDAAASLGQAVALAPSDADAWHRLGVVELRRSNLDGARRAFSKTIELAPRRPEPLYNLALVERRAGNEAAAEARLREAIALNPRYAEALYELATGYLASRQPERALDAYNAALAARPDYAEALFGAARAALDLGRSEEARRNYERFVAVAPREYARQIAAAREVLRRLAPRQ